MGGDTMNATWRMEVINKALMYANYKWFATADHVNHGLDKDGIMVNTPDVNQTSIVYPCGWWKIGEENQGIPYNWGGSSTIEAFAEGLAKGLYPGNVPDSRDNGVSQYTVGLDCSGLVAICWAMDKKLSTRALTQVAEVLPSIDDLLPGDILLKPGSHVMIFQCFLELPNKAAIIDATRSTGKVSRRIIDIDLTLEKGFLPYRKRFVSPAPYFV